MRPVSILLGILTIVLGLVCIQLRQTASDQLAVAQQQTQTVSNALRNAQADLATYKTQQEAVIAQQTIVMTQLVQQVAALTVAKTAVEAQSQQAHQQAEKLTQELATTRETVQTLEIRITTLQKRDESLTIDTATLTEQLRKANQHLADQEKAQSATAAQSTLQADQQSRLELESLTARWNSLPALHDQVCAVKKRMREERIAADKRIEAEADAAGNHGTLMHQGYWHTTPATIPEVH